MLIFPKAKINLGLHVVARRSDGYHNLETVFFPVPLTDCLEIQEMDRNFPSTTPCDLKVTGMAVDGDEQQNLVIRAYMALAQDYDLPRLHIHLHKRIPSQAGLGGGSSDAAAMLLLINEMAQLALDTPTLIRYAAKIGADCAFFIQGKPAYATGIGDQLNNNVIDTDILKGYYLAIVKPPVAVSTKEAYALVRPQQPQHHCLDVLQKPVARWRGLLVNDFEKSVFQQLPEVRTIKDTLYDKGAVFALMSGSGSAVFGIFEQEPTLLQPAFPNCQVFTMPL